MDIGVDVDRRVPHRTAIVGMQDASDVHVHVDVFAPFGERPRVRGPAPGRVPGGPPLDGIERRNRFESGPFESEEPCLRRPDVDRIGHRDAGRCVALERSHQAPLPGGRVPDLRLVYDRPELGSVADDGRHGPAGVRHRHPVPIGIQWMQPVPCGKEDPRHPLMLSRCAERVTTQSGHTRRGRRQRRAPGAPECDAADSTFSFQSVAGDTVAGSRSRPQAVRGFNMHEPGRQISSLLSGSGRGHGEMSCSG